MARARSKLASFVFDNSLLLLAGTIAAGTWANLDVAGYDRVAHLLHFWVNDVGMVFFFALAAKEVFEATLPDGPLSSPRQALSPLAAAVGGMVAPAVIYLALTSSARHAELSRGWAIPCATDIAFSAMIARVIFRPGHPAIPFLLLLAIADDALGLIILAVFYPSGPLSIIALATLMTVAVLAALWLRRHRVRSFWPYAVPACSPGPRSTSVVSIPPWRWYRSFRSCPTVREILGCSTPEHISKPTRSVSSSIGGRRPYSSYCCSLGWRMPASRSGRLARGHTSSWPPCCLANRSAS
jgi:hypothetical protein